MGSPIGTSNFVNSFVSSKEQSWCDELSLLADIARSQLHAVFSSYTHGFTSKWTFLCRITPNVFHFLKPLILLFLQSLHNNHSVMIYSEISCSE